MIVWRVAPRDRRGPLWFPRELQGAGRHDNPDRYGCLYVSLEAVAAVAETLAPFRGAGPLDAAMLRRAGRPLALTAIDLAEPATATLVDLDEPATLARERLRPSQVATRRRERTRAYACAIFERRRDAAGIRWWSTLESSWIHLTLFDRAAPALAARGQTDLDAGHPAVLSAAELLGLG